MCKAYTPGKADQDLHARISRLEQIVEQALPQFCTPGTPSTYPNEQYQSNTRHRTPSNGDDDSRSQTDEQDLSGGIFQSGKWYGTSASGSVAPASVIEQVSPTRILWYLSQRLFPQIEYAGITSNNAEHPNGPDNMHSIFPSSHSAQNLRAKGALDIVDEDSEPSAADNLKSLVQECGVSPLKISELLQELPPPRVAEVLIDYYFTSM